MVKNNLEYKFNHHPKKKHPKKRAGDDERL